MIRWLTFIVVAFSVMFGGHYYIWIRLVRDTALGSPWKQVFTILIVFFALFLPSVLFLTRVLPREILRPLAFLAYSWMGFAVFLLSFQALNDLLRLLFWFGRWLSSSPPPSLERRIFFARVTEGFAVFTSAFLGGFGAKKAFGGFYVERVKVLLARLPKVLSGTTIAQISDLHIGPTIGREFIERVVNSVNRLSPDIIVITGDLVDGSVEELRDHVAPLSDLRARSGVYFVTGNHDYYSGADAWVQEVRRLGISVLRNERVSIGRAENSFDLVGIDDYNAFSDPESHKQALIQAMEGSLPERETVLLAHQPRSIHAAASQNIGLQLSGHTHGGQLLPWKYFVGLQQPFVAGLSRVENTWIYVNRGTGFWGPPIRLGANPEITLIELTRED